MTENLPTIKLEDAPATLEQYANNLQTKVAMAATLLKSGLIPQHFKTPEAVLCAILYGQEIGMSPMQSLLAVTVIQGKPTLDAAGIKAKCIQAGGRFETIKWDEKVCRLRGVRGEWKEEVEFTIQDAATAGYTQKDNWKRMPKAMLYARCVSIIGRNMFADVLKGFYSKEEMLDSVSAEPQKPVILAEVVKPAEEAKQEAAPEVFSYRIENISRDQQLFFEKRGFVFNHDCAAWQGPQNLGPKLEKYLVRDEPEAVKEVA